MKNSKKNLRENDGLKGNQQTQNNQKSSEEKNRKTGSDKNAGEETKMPGREIKTPVAARKNHQAGASDSWNRSSNQRGNSKNS